MAYPDSSSFGLEIRLAYLEAKLFLDGEYSTLKIRALGISRQTASADINVYVTRYGHVMNYCPSRKRYILDRRFKPRILLAKDLAPFARYVESVHALAYKIKN
jgi:hypothetical protein